MNHNKGSRSLRLNSLSRTHIVSLDFEVVNRFFMKLYNTNNIKIVMTNCQEYLCCVITRNSAIFRGE